MPRLRIQTADPSRDLWVPTETRAYADVRGGLSHWVPLTVTPFRLGFPGPSIAVTVLALAAGLFRPIKLGPFAAGLVISQAVIALATSDASLLRRVMPFVALLILLVRWLS